MISVMAVPVKNTAVGDGYQPVLVLSGTDSRWRQGPSTAVRDKGALQLSLLCVVLHPRGRSSAVIGGIFYHGHQRPLPTNIHRADSCHYDSMACFAVRGKGGLSRPRASLSSFWQLVLCQPQAKHGRDEFEF